MLVLPKHYCLIVSYVDLKKLRLPQMFPLPFADSGSPAHVFPVAFISSDYPKAQATNHSKSMLRDTYSILV